MPIKQSFGPIWIICSNVSLTLVVALCLKCAEQVRKNLETLEETWNNYQVYLNDEIDFIDDEPMLDYSLRRKEK